MEPSRPVDLDAVAQAMARRLDTRVTAEGQITFPAVPALLEEFTEKCVAVFAGLGRAFDAPERDHLQDVLKRQLAEAFSRSPRSTITVVYRSPVASALSYDVTVGAPSVEEVYQNWVATRTPPLFGVEPDARVWALAGEVADPAGSPVLDIGAGTGRNALALARRGHPVDVVEMTEIFADIIGEQARQNALDIRVINRDVFATDADLRRDYRIILLSEVVCDFRSPEQLRRLLELADRCLAPGGSLVFNIFLADAGYAPDEAARQFGQQVHTAFFTRPELEAALGGLALRMVSDDSVYDYERANLPDGAWPPTGWYANWVSGHDLFALDREHCPIDMRWLVFAKAPE